MVSPMELLWSVVQRLEILSLIPSEIVDANFYSILPEAVSRSLVMSKHSGRGKPECFL